MPAITPDQVHELWSKAFIAHDLPALLALYEPDAVLAPSPDEHFQGRDAIRAALENFLALRPTFQMSSARVVQAGGASDGFLYPIGGFCVPRGVINHPSLNILSPG